MNCVYLDVLIYWLNACIINLSNSIYVSTEGRLVWGAYVIANKKLSISFAKDNAKVERTFQVDARTPNLAASASTLGILFYVIWILILLVAEMPFMVAGPRESPYFHFILLFVHSTLDFHGYIHFLGQILQLCCVVCSLSTNIFQHYMRQTNTISTNSQKKNTVSFFPFFISML